MIMHTEIYESELVASETGKILPVSSSQNYHAGLSYAKIKGALHNDSRKIKGKMNPLWVMKNESHHKQVQFLQHCL